MTTHKIPDFRALEKFIDSQREKQLMLMVRRYGLQFDDAEDVYQDASVALYTNINSGRLTELTASLSTYFTRICFNQAKKRLGKKAKAPDSLDEISLTQQFDTTKVDELLGLTDDANNDIVTEQIAAMRNVVCDLGEPCEKILWSFYADDMNMADIAVLLEYKNADTVKAKKSQCMSRLRQRFNSIIG